MRYFLFLVLATSSIIAQFQATARLEIEMFLLIQSLDETNNQEIFFRLESIQGFVWAGARFERYNFQLNYDSVFNHTTLPLDYENFPITSNSNFPNNKNWTGFDFAKGSEEHTPEQSDFAYGLYSLTPYEIVVQNNEQIEVELGGRFYLDMRDSHYPHIIGLNCTL
ncbi:MAG: hypothetical protein PHW27_10595 [Melioribacteraceae bacterium]|nr:hypothetical protein [Melioribacteraceae bacterium]